MSTPPPLPPALRRWVADNLLRGLPRDHIVDGVLESPPAAAAARRALFGDPPTTADRGDTRRARYDDAGAPDGIDGIPSSAPSRLQSGARDGSTPSDGTPRTLGVDDIDAIDGTSPSPLADALRAAVDALAATPELAAGLAATRRLRQLELIHRLGRTLAERSHPPGDAPDDLPIPRRPDLTAAQFYLEHYAGWRPVVLPGFAADWPARRWTPAALAARFGDVEVSVTDDRERDPDYDMRTPQHTRRVPLRAFVERIEAAGASNDCYMVAQNRVLQDPAMAPLMDDVPLDPAWFRPDRWKGCSALWLGPAGTVTPLHHDTCNILFVQLYGRKRITLASPLETTLLDGARSMYAAVDPEAHDGPVRFSRVVLEPGDAIFLPVGWWHHVRALDVSISLALTNFRRGNTFPDYVPGAAR